MYRAYLLLSLCIVASFGTLSNAGLPITSMVGNPPPSTAPSDPVSIMLLPFRSINQNADSSWISQAVDEDLAHDLSRNRAIRVIRPATTQPLAATDGLADARSAKAQRLISGSYQVVDDQLRITANVVDVSGAQSVGEVKATGRVRDLFQLEDSLAMQLWHVLPQGSEQALENDFQVTPLEDYTASQQAAPQQTYVAPPADVESTPAYDTASNYYSPYNLAYPYGDYGYGYAYGGFGLPIFVYGGFGHGFNHHDGFRGGERGGERGGNQGTFHGGGERGGGGLRSPGIAQPTAPRGIASPGMSGGAHFGGGHR